MIKTGAVSDTSLSDQFAKPHDKACAREQSDDCHQAEGLKWREVQVTAPEASHDCRHSMKKSTSHSLEPWPKPASHSACIAGGVYVMPVLQGFKPSDYVAHIRMYADALRHGAWVGVGSVCKRNGDAKAIEAVLLAIKQERPDLLLHGFGLKTTALGSGLVRSLLHTADSMAWSFAARKQGGNANCWREAEKFLRRIDTMPVQYQLLKAAA